MKEITGSLAQLFAVIMILITLAVSTAALSQWANADVVTQSNEQDTVRQHNMPLLVSDAHH